MVLMLRESHLLRNDLEICSSGSPLSYCYVPYSILSATAYCLGYLRCTAVLRGWRRPTNYNCCTTRAAAVTRARCRCRMPFPMMHNLHASRRNLLSTYYNNSGGPSRLHTRETARKSPIDSLEKDQVIMWQASTKFGQRILLGSERKETARVARSADSPWHPEPSIPYSGYLSIPAATPATSLSGGGGGMDDRGILLPLSRCEWCVARWFIFYYFRLYKRSYKSGVICRNTS